MKKLFLLAIFALQFSLFIHAQNCVAPASSDIVSIQYKKTQALPTDQLKLNSVNTWLRGKCLLSSDAKQLAVLLLDDGVRLDFAISVYPSIFDKQNYYNLFDAFNSLSYAFRFYDFVNSNIIEYNTVPIPDPVPVKLFPDLNYPSPAGYNGIAGCSLPMSDNDFNVLVKPVVDAQGDVNRGTVASQFVQSNCVSMAQLMMLGTLIQLDINRQKFMKQNFAKCYDLQNFPSSAQVFTTQSYKDDWNSFADATVKSLLPPPVVVCMVSNEDMSAILTQLGNQSFASTKVSTAKTILAAKKCFTVLQIKEIVKQMSFEGDKLDVAKYAYDFCIDKQNYYQLTDVFDFDSSSSDLLSFLKGKQ